METAREEAELLDVLKTIHRPFHRMAAGDIPAKYQTINDKYWSLRALPTSQAISTAYWRSREESLDARQ